MSNYEIQNKTSTFPGLIASSVFPSRIWILHATPPIFGRRASAAIYVNIVQGCHVIFWLTTLERQQKSQVELSKKRENVIGIWNAWNWVALMRHTHTLASWFQRPLCHLSLFTFPPHLCHHQISRTHANRAYAYTFISKSKRFRYTLQSTFLCLRTMFRCGGRRIRY